MTGTLQNHARKYQVAIDTLTYGFEFYSVDNPEDVDTEEVPEDGVLVNGLFLDGAKWNKEKKIIDDSNPGEMYFPVRAPAFHAAVAASLCACLLRTGPDVCFFLLPTDAHHSLHPHQGLRAGRGHLVRGTCVQDQHTCRYAVDDGHFHKLRGHSAHADGAGAIRVDVAWCRTALPAG